MSLPFSSLQDQTLKNLLIILNDKICCLVAAVEAAEAGGMASLEGMNVNNTDPQNPVIEVTEVTVAQAQALASGSDFIPGNLYRITDAGVAGMGLDTGTLNVKALSASALESYGYGTFRNGAMSAAISCYMMYDLADDEVRVVHDPEKGNYVAQYITGDAITTLPFDSATIFGNHIEDGFINLTGDCTIVNTVMRPGSRINMGSQGSAAVDSCVLEASATVTINEVAENGANFTFCYFGADSEASIGDGDTVDKCFIGPEKIFTPDALTTSGYTATGKVYFGNISTFEITPANEPAVNPTAGGEIVMTNFTWAGILKPSSAANDLDTFTQFPTDHAITIAPSVDNFDVLDATAVGGNNIYLEVAASTVTLDGSTNKDFLVFTFSGGRIVKSGGYVRS